MPDLRNDIEKYRKGELSPSEMHKLEKRALSDPFLSDALEGIETISNQDLSNDLKDLSERIRKEKKNIFTPLRIAAGIFLVLGASFLFFLLSNRTNEEKHLAQKTENKSDSNAGPKITKDSAASENLITLKVPEKIKKEEATQPPKQNSSSEIISGEALTDTSTEDQISELEDKQEESKAEEKITEVVPTMEPVIELKEKQDEQKIAANETPAQLQKGSLSKTDLSRAKKNISPASKSEASGSTAYQINNNIRGQVTSTADGSPMPGVNVVLKGTTTGTITDDQGNYVIELPETKEPALVFSFIGAQTDEVPVNDQSVVNVQMKDDVSQLSEVVVVGYGADDTAEEPVIPTLLLAEPTGGKRAFRKYLETNLQYPQQALQSKIEGRVTIQFTVQTDGTLDDFKVIKGLGYGCENEVIRLIKSGPKWSPARKAETPVASRFRVRMRFKLPD
jgi:TonB family protein